MFERYTEYTISLNAEQLKVALKGVYDVHTIWSFKNDSFLMRRKFDYFEHGRLPITTRVRGKLTHTPEGIRIDFSWASATGIVDIVCFGLLTFLLCLILFGLEGLPIKYSCYFTGGALAFFCLVTNICTKGSLTGEHLYNSTVNSIVEAIKMQEQN